MEEISTIPFDELKFQPNFQIPFDLFVSKKSKGLGTPGFLRFSDSTGKLMYSVQKLSSKSTHPHIHSLCTKLVLDSSGNTLLSIHRINGSWQGFWGNSSEEKDLIFKVERTIDEYTSSEFEIFLLGEDNKDLKMELKMKGNPFKRSCTIYKGDSIVAESSLMLGIGKIFVPRNRFRVTVFPGFLDQSLVVSFIVIYFDGRKLWI